MEALILNTNFEAIYILDVFSSFIWTDRFNDCGDFEICTSPTVKNLSFLKPDNYIWIKESDRLMVIEENSIETNEEDLPVLTIRGSSIESILNRRIVWNQTTLQGNLQDAIEKILDENVISPDNENRKIPNFVFEKNEETAISSLDIDAAQYTGAYIYNIISDLCKTKDIGCKMIFEESGSCNYHREIPFDLYEEQKYIESDGNAYIDTGIIQQLTTRMDAKIAFNTLTVGRFGSFGYSGSTLNSRFYFGVEGNHWAAGINASAYKHDIEDADTNRHVFSIYDKTFKIDGREVYTSDGGTATNANLYLFAVNDKDVPNYKATCKLYEFKIWNDNVLAMKLIPVKRRSDDIYGFYDLVTKTFIENSGTGVFTGGGANIAEGPKFVFSLYTGTDRSYYQTTNPYIVFSPKLDNVVSTNFVENNSSECNIVLVAGEGEGTDQKVADVYIETTEPAGLHRKEMYETASDISSKTEEKTLTDEEYKELLKQRGKEVLSKDENRASKTFDAELNANGTMKYGVDFFIGDIVELIDSYGSQSRIRVSEMIRCDDENGYTEYPTFSKLLKEPPYYTNQIGDAVEFNGTYTATQNDDALEVT